MPELPEVETTKNDLKAKILGARILRVESDWKKAFKDPDLKVFQDMVRGAKIVSISRRAKNLILTLSDGMNIVFHLRMTGHMIVAGNAEIDGLSWVKPIKNEYLADPQNRFLHHIFYLDNDKVLALSDLRKFATISLMDRDKLDVHFSDLGPEPMEDKFSEQVFFDIMKKTRGPVKKVLLDQSKIAGIGNIYADEILFDCWINPTTPVEKLKDKDLQELYISTVKILREAIKLRGTSISDFRDTEGKKGSYQDVRRVYKRKNEPCVRCGSPVARIVVAQRGTHYCPNCQPKRK